MPDLIGKNSLLYLATFQIGSLHESSLLWNPALYHDHMYSTYVVHEQSRKCGLHTLLFFIKCFHVKPVEKISNLTVPE